MHEKFRENVISVGEKGLGWLKEYFEGAELPTDKLDKAMKILQLSVKTPHIMQLDEQVKRSQAIRLLNFIPKEHRSDYIALTNPEAKPFLLSKPEKKK